MEIVDAKASAYAEKFSSPESASLADIAEQTLAHAHAHMLSGHVQGKFLEMISRLLRPSAILEIGTFTGYSALCLAAGLADKGKLHTIELRDDDADISQENFSKSLYNENIILHSGNALDIIPGLNEEWDLVFIDADKMSIYSILRINFAEA